MLARYMNAKLQVGSSDLLDGNQLAGYLTNNYTVEPTSYETFLQTWRTTE